MDNATRLSIMDHQQPDEGRFPFFPLFNYSRSERGTISNHLAINLARKKRLTGPSLKAEILKIFYIYSHHLSMARTTEEEDGREK